MRPEVKKIVLSLLPYVFLAWLFGKGAACYRLSAGPDMVSKLMGAVSGLGEHLSSDPLPSLHPRDLLFGLCAAAAIRAAVYVKGKNAKKYRHGVEYGSARWARRRISNLSLIPSSTRTSC